MGSVKVLDVTLRDGGCVNNFNFGHEYMNSILCALEQSEVDFIELGYIDEKNGSEKDRTQYINEDVIKSCILKNKKPNIDYVVMMDYGKFNVDNLKPNTGEGIDGIRMAFHKKNWKDMLKQGRKIIDKGYKFYVQPMLTLRYSDMELLELIRAVNEQLSDASGFYIVDSFGEMRGKDVTRLMHIVDNNLNSNITLGFHSHNNLQLSYSNAMSLLSFSTERNLMIDSSVMGMGKGAGNLNTELLLEHMNIYYGKNYKISPLLALIDQVINVIHEDIYWGYTVEYYLSAINHCTPSYAGLFYNKHMLPIEQVSELLSMIPEEKKISFDKNFAEELYVKYNASKSFDDNPTIEKLQKRIEGKTVLVVAPGKSINTVRSLIETILSDKDIVSISLNNFDFETDYVLTTRNEMFYEAVKLKHNIIVPSNISQIVLENIYILDYQKWIVTGEKTYDSSGVIVLNLLKELKVNKIMLAGFDGFSVNMNENYYSATMRKPITEELAVCRNEFYKGFIADIGTKVTVEFLTPSKYN